MEIGSVLRNIRKANELSQDEMAALMNVSQGVISKYEKNDSEPGITFIRHFRRLFGYDLAADNIMSVVIVKTFDKQTGQPLFKKEESDPPWKPDTLLLTQVKSEINALLVSLRKLSSELPEPVGPGTEVDQEFFRNALGKTNSDKH